MFKYRKNMNALSVYHEGATTSGPHNNVPRHQIFDFTLQLLGYQSEVTILPVEYQN